MSEYDARPEPPVGNLLHATDLVRTGHKAEALEMVRRLVAVRPNHLVGWLWLSAISPDRAEAEAALARARAVNPAHPRLVQAEQWLAHRFPAEPAIHPAPMAAAPLPVSAEPSASRGLIAIAGRKLLAFPAALKQSRLFRPVMAALVVMAVASIGSLVVLLNLGFGLNATALAHPDGSGRDQAESGVDVKNALADPDSALNQAWKQRDWARAITILEKFYASQPAAPELTERLAHAYIQQGIALRHKGFIEKALLYFEHALVAAPQEPHARRELRLAASYLEGIHLYQAGQWSQVIETLQPVWREDSDYVNVHDLLYSAYYNHGLATQAAGQLGQAREAFRAAINLRPDLVEPRQKMAELEFALGPKTPPDTPIPAVPVKDQMIVVGILEQKMWVYEGKRRVFEFVVSTGEPGRDTAIGDFEILDKIEMAYASTWNLDMPYWMGIYWAGPLENGIHALPIVRHTGYKLWDGYLGQRVSYGCVILSDKDAATLFDWAQVGARVKIVYSLAEWLPKE